MKELLESKTMIALILFVIGVLVLNSYMIKQEQKNVSGTSTNTINNLDK